MLIWTSAHITDVGTRRKINEDSVLESPIQGIWAVADGMGGHAAGDYASQLITSRLRALNVRQRQISEVVDEVDQAIEAVNHQLRLYAREKQMGTVGSTVVVMILSSRVGVCLWAGDSRLYRVREHQLERISSDHSLIQRLIDQGTLQESEAHLHPARNVITRAVGADEELALDCRLFDPLPGDSYILCSDGLYNEVDELDLCDLAAGLNPRDAADCMLTVALEGGADDNVSAIVVKIRD